MCKEDLFSATHVHTYTHPCALVVVTRLPLRLSSANPPPQTTKTRSDTQRVRMSSGERAIGTRQTTYYRGVVPTPRVPCPPKCTKTPIPRPNASSSLTPPP